MDRRRNLSALAAAAAKAKRSNIARLHFRAAVRLAYENHYWLEDTEGLQLGMNVAKNIQILTRKKRKGDFSLKEPTEYFMFTEWKTGNRNIKVDLRNISYINLTLLTGIRNPSLNFSQSEMILTKPSLYFEEIILFEEQRHLLRIFINNANLCEENCGLATWAEVDCRNYFLCGYVKSLVYADNPETFDHLEDNIRRVITGIRPQMMEEVIGNWTSRLDYVLASRHIHSEFYFPNISKKTDWVELKSKQNFDKAIMKVSQEKRTEEEKRTLRRVLATMKCFRKYPSEVKKDLAAITYYAEYDADRMIVRQGDDARALYFVISGTARVLLTKIDPLTGEKTVETVKIKEAGDMFGELALLIGTKRSATITTNEKSEFLYVKREDFDRVLKDSVLKEWDEIKRSITMFEYFKTWDDRYIQESCMVSKMRYYDEYALILSEDYGDKRNVYFLIEGSVDLLECVEMEVTTFKNKKTYSLYNPFDAVPYQRGKSLTVDLAKFFRDRLEPRKSDSDLDLTGQRSMRFSFGSGEFEDYLRRSLSNVYTSENGKKRGRRFRKSIRRPSSIKVLTNLSPADRVNYVKQRESRLSRVTCPKEISVSTIETHFMRIAKMGPLGSFNIGEHLDSRFYVSRTKIKLLAIPQYWLFSRDKPTWNNLSIFLRKRLPTRQQLYEQFAMKQTWLQYRQELYFDIADQSRKSNINSIHNVPLSLRLNEDFNFYVSSRPLPQKKGSSDKDEKSVKV